MKVSLKQAHALLSANINVSQHQYTDLKLSVGHILAEDQIARMDQPPHRASMMDGIGINCSNTIQAATKLNLTGEIPAGTNYTGSLDEHEAVRVYTGSALPACINHVIPQEECIFNENIVEIKLSQQPDGKFIRNAGIDFSASETLLLQGTKLTPLHCGLLASANIQQVKTSIRPKVIIITNGEELCDPQPTLQPAQVIDSISFTLPHLIQQWGGEVVQTLRLKDDFDAICATLQAKTNLVDFIITVGGASVGKYDYFKDAVKQLNGKVLFSKVNIRPGQPCWYGKLANTNIIGLPGNPASAVVCAHLLAKIALGIFSDDTSGKQLNIISASCNQALESNGARDHFLRCTTTHDASGQLVATTDARLDSSLLSPFVQANGLLWREANAGPAQANTIHKVILL